MSYDPTDCELGICGPCDACQEQQIDLGPEEEMKPEPQLVRPHHTRSCPKGCCDGTNPELSLAPGLEPLSGKVTKKTLIGTIDITPSWVAVVGIYLELLEESKFSPQQRKGMKDEILRAAKLADLYVKEHGRSKKN